MRSLKRGAIMTSHVPASIGAFLEEVETPSLLLDLDAFERNLKRMADAVAGTAVRLRPHSKSHKCPTIALKQIEYGAVGVCCQKVSEAEAMVNGGVKDVYISNEIVAHEKIQRLAALAKQARIAIAVDHPDNVKVLSQTALRLNVELSVLVEVNVGANRCGIDPGEQVISLVRQISGSGGLRFAGLQAYHGGAQHLLTYEERKSAILSAVEKVKLTKQFLEQAGFSCEQVTGSGTGTYCFELGSGVFTELQAGSYVFMDVDYGRIQGKDGGLYRDFDHSLFVYTQVMSCPSSDHVVVDSGLKAFSTENGVPLVYRMPEVQCRQVSDEHSVLKITNPERILKLGDKIRLIPPHCDPTVNLHDWYVGFRGKRVETLWPITARGPGY
jgi:3-hydroxy-D-aspartate aldolase